MMKIRYDSGAFEELEELLELTRKEYQEGKFDLRYINQFESFVTGRQQKELMDRGCADLLNETALVSLRQIPEENVRSLEKWHGRLRDRKNFLRKLLPGGGKRKAWTHDNVFDLVGLLMSCLEKEIEEKLGCNFIVTQLEADRSVRNFTTRSGLWHFDPAPFSHYKVIVYLSSKTQTDGCTYFLENESSRELLSDGYNNVPPDQRFSQLPGSLSGSDMKELSGRGESMLFQPGTICHKAVYPTTGVRDTFTISLLKVDGIHWKDAFQAIYSVSELRGDPAHARWPIVA
jgi:hypothetical protein